MSWTGSMIHVGDPLQCGQHKAKILPPTQDATCRIWQAADCLKRLEDCRASHEVLRLM
jgi:hypothetical protein